MKIYIPMKENFRAHWLWVKKTGGWKDDWPGFKTIHELLNMGVIENEGAVRIAIINTCFACGESAARGRRKCDKCPIPWASHGMCIDSDSEYCRYLEAKRSRLNHEAGEIAGEIAAKEWVEDEHDR